MDREGVIGGLTGDAGARRRYAALAALVLVGAVIRIVYASQDLFADELSTYWIISTNGLGGVIDTVHSTAEITPPLGFVLSWLATRIDLTPELLRLPALVGGIGSIPLVYAIGTRTVGRGAALLAAAMTTLSPFMLYYSAEARGYGLMVFLLLCSTLSMLLAVERGGRRWWVAYALFTCATAYTHYTAIFVMAVQFAWVLWAHPEARRPAIVAAVAAAVGFLPWASGLKGDLDSPTTEILSMLSPFDLDSIKTSLEHWVLGFPYASAGGLRALPGVPALLLLAAALVVGAAGAVTSPVPPRRWFHDPGRRLALVAALALATPVGEAVASLIGSNVFGTRNLAASWPYLALLGAALLTVGRMRLRIATSALVVVAFAIAAGRMLGTDYERPAYGDAADYIESIPAAVAVDDTGVTPGPLTHLDVSLDPGIPDFRLKVPEERDHPFEVGDPLPDQAAVTDRAVAAADGGPIALVLGTDVPPPPQFLERLPAGYRVTAERAFPSFLDLRVLVYERPEAQH
jgi:Dolichyl-phosphate-mannose-protein mannosyltransferase